MTGKILHLMLALMLLGLGGLPAAKSAAAPIATTTATRTPVRTTTPTAPPTPTATATVDVHGLPWKAEVAGMWGYGQLFGLSCESRSAADWARHFHIDIRERAFLGALPRSPNPDAGFVGSHEGGWGNIPPLDYGVHAGPVARLLRQGYGAHALAVRQMTFERLRREIAAGRPVIVWVTGHVAPGKGETVEIDGQTVTVARYEHTVIVTGYDTKNVKILDGKQVYTRSIEVFLKAWSPLENMAIIWDEASVGRQMERQAVKKEYTH